MKLSVWLANSGTSQSELARRLGITQGRVSQLVAGALPSLDLANKIAAATGNKVRAQDFGDQTMAKEQKLDLVEDAIKAIAGVLPRAARVTSPLRAALAARAARAPLDVARLLAPKYPAQPIMSYIPALARVSPLRFGIALRTCDGPEAAAGDADTAAELLTKATEIGFPVVIKPVMSSSGKGQSVAKTAADIATCWDYACAGMRGDRQKVIVEEFIHFDFEITLLTIRQRNGKTLFCEPIGHVQERGDYQYSWQPQPMQAAYLKAAQDMAEKVTTDLGGAGLFGVEFFVTRDEVIFSELSPRPHDTGMVTLVGQNLSEFRWLKMMIF